MTVIALQGSSSAVYFMTDMEEYFDFINGELALWELARDNYAGLGQTRRRLIELRPLTVGVQCNPARMVSTGADTSKKGIAARKCFLCAANRPPEQHSIPFDERFEILLNPFPIFPVHFTIPSVRHEPQDAPPEEMLSIADRLRGLTVFFNGAKAGASAPDHLHVQAVATHELPLMRFVEEHHSPDRPAVCASYDLADGLPFLFYSGIIQPTLEGMKDLRLLLDVCGRGEDGTPDCGLVNSYIWFSERIGRMRYVVIPRRAHRPSCYFKEGHERIVVSPGAVDMAGVMILPREEDYDKVSEKDIRQIYSEVAYPSVPPDWRSA